MIIIKTEKYENNLLNPRWTTQIRYCLCLPSSQKNKDVKKGRMARYKSCLMIGWIEIFHPITGETIKAVPTGRTEEGKAEVLIITPKSNLDKIWITKEQLIN